MPTRLASRLLSLFLLAWIAPTLLMAQAPQLINFQGTVQGTSLPAQLSITFEIYDAETDGALLWSEDQMVNHVDGAFNALLGSAIPFPTDLFSSDGDRYLDLVVEGNALASRYQLSSVAYALRSAHADNAGPDIRNGNDARLNFYTSNNAFDSRAWIEMWGQETATEDDPGRSGELTLAGRYISFWTGSATDDFGGQTMSLSEDGNLVATGSIRSLNGGFIFPDGTTQTTAAASGTSNPIRIEAEGTRQLQVANPSTTDDSAPAEVFFDRGPAGDAQVAAVGVGGTERDFFVWVNGADRFTIDEGGDVGIGGQPNFFARFDVKNDESRGFKVLNLPATDGDALIGEWFGNGAAPQMRITGGGSGFIDYGHYQNGAYFIEQEDRTVLQLYPTGRTHLSGNNDTGAQTFEPTIDLAIDDNDSGLDVPSDGTLALYTDNVERLRINNGGLVGIGTETPATALHVNGDVSVEAGKKYLFGVPSGLGGEGEWMQNTLSETSGHGLGFYTSFTERMRIASGTGFVGIGTDNPTNILTIPQDSNTDPIADAWTTYSSRRWKTNIETIKDPLGIVSQLRGVTYDWKETGKHDIGLIAEEVGAILPELVHFEENGVDARSIDYPRLVALLIEAVKEQQQDIERLEALVQDIERLEVLVQTLVDKP